MDAFRQQVVQALHAHLDVPVEKIERLLSKPRNPEMGDLALPCHPFGNKKEKEKAPAAQLAARLAGEIAPAGLIHAVEAVGPFLNFRINPAGVVALTLEQIHRERERYGTSDVGAGKTVVVDYSSPNIAKPFHVGHLRTTIIGAALARIFEARGYRVVRVNHLGDWGTQFGLTQVAFEESGDEARFEAEGVNYLVELYVAASRRAETDPRFRERARAAFKALEDGDPQARAFWQRSREISLRDFRRVYDMIGVTFDTFDGEAFYNDKIDAAIQQATDAGVTEQSEGALVVYVDEAKKAEQPDQQKRKPPVLLRKSDGATTYHARDLAAALYRKKEYEFDLNVYVVGAEQRLHFQQLFKLLERMKLPWAARCVHVPFGRILGMRTREGGAIRLDELFDEAMRRAEPIVRQQNERLAPDDPLRLSDAEILAVAKAVGLGAVFFFDLSRRRVKDIEFNWDRVLQPIGDTGPYVQYAHARMCSILRKRGGTITGAADTSLLSTPHEVDLAKVLADFPSAIAQAQDELEPSVIGLYLLELAEKANIFHKNCHVIRAAPELSAARALLVDCTRVVLRAGLGLLGITAPERM